MSEDYSKEIFFCGQTAIYFFWSARLVAKFLAKHVVFSTIV